MEMDGAAVLTLVGLRLCSAHQRRSSTQQLQLTRVAQRTPVVPETESLPGWLHRLPPPLTWTKLPTPDLAGIPDGEADACLSGQMDDQELTSPSLGACGVLMGHHYAVNFNLSEISLDSLNEISEGPNCGRRSCNLKKIVLINYQLFIFEI